MPSSGLPCPGEGGCLFLIIGISAYLPGASLVPCLFLVIGRVSAHGSGEGLSVYGHGGDVCTC